MTTKNNPAKNVFPERVTKNWNLLIYIAGDNNLSDAGIADIEEMCQEGSSEDVYVGVEIDTYGEHTGSIRYEITEPDWTGKAHRKVIERLSEQDTGDPGTLNAFIKWGIDRYDAKNRLLVVWNHGAGFRSPRRDIGYDDFGSSLNMPEISTALERSGITKKNPLQIMGFDACLMNMLEIVHHFQDQVEIIVGSQQTEPGDGWPYDKVLKKAKLAKTPKALATGIVKEYISYYKEKGVNDVTQSAVSTKLTTDVVKALDQLGDLLIVKFDSIKKDMKTVRMASQEFSMADYVDLIHLSELITRAIKDAPIKEAAEKVISTTKACILSNAKLGTAVDNANGLSIWFPATQNTYFDNRAIYLNLKCNSTEFGWRKFLDRYHQ